MLSPATNLVRLLLHERYGEHLGLSPGHETIISVARRDEWVRLADVRSEARRLNVHEETIIEALTGRRPHG